MTQSEKLVRGACTMCARMGVQCAMCSMLAPGRLRLAECVCIEMTSLPCHRRRRIDPDGDPVVGDRCSRRTCVVGLYVAAGGGAVVGAPRNIRSG